MEFIPLFWLILGVILVGSEFIIPGFVIFFFGIGALIMAGLTKLFPGIHADYLLQRIIWFISSFTSLGLLRRFFGKTFQGKVIKGKVEDEYILKHAIAMEDLKPNIEGRVKFQGTTWKAITYDEEIKKGESVEILRKII